jgi:hypothetical protein
MPDFDQKQYTWYNSTGQWNWCGPVAVANCLWWFDSKFERIWLWSHFGNLNNLFMPPIISDHYNLVYSFLPSTRDDHHPANFRPFVQHLVTFLPAGGVPEAGVNASDIKTMIDDYLASVGLRGHFSVTIVSSPSFNYIYQQVKASQDVILLLGFWQYDSNHEWVRFGGHWVTVAGVWTDAIPTTFDSISFSDPYKNLAEVGLPGTVWNGFLINHAPIPGHAAAVHNDAGNVSHDFQMVGNSGSPGGVCSPWYYGDYEWSTSDWLNFQELNCPERLHQYERPYDPSQQYWHAEVEDIVVVCPNFDYGDLQGDYPTQDIESCGPAHPLTEKAWLGESIDAEVSPDTLNLDSFDDGVTFYGLPWVPCDIETVRVVVTVGPYYAGEVLYLNAWDDGNVDGDFDDGPNAGEDDYLCCSEWIIRDQMVVSGVYTYIFCDPGPTSGGVARKPPMRFRLTSEPVGRFGYGGVWYGGNSNGWGTHDIDWVLGEVEDYFWPRSCDPVIDLTARVVSGSLWLYWTAPQPGLYDIYSTTNPNHGPLPGLDWTWEARVTVVSDSDRWMDPNTLPWYKNYGIIHVCPDSP